MEGSIHFICGTVPGRTVPLSVQIRLPCPGNDSWTPNLILPMPGIWPCFVEGASEYREQKIPWKEVGIKALDDKTLRVELSGPYPFFINAMAHQSFAVLPMHLLEIDGGLGRPR